MRPDLSRVPADLIRKGRRSGFPEFNPGRPLLSNRPRARVRTRGRTRARARLDETGFLKLVLEILETAGIGFRPSSS
jgi:hypothetical protein